MKKPAKLRTCAMCEWIFDDGIDCPQCGFGSYGAHYVYGDRAYRYAKTQKPWFDNKMATYSHNLRMEIKQKMNDKSSNTGFDKWGAQV